MLLRDKILQVKDIQEETVDLTDIWGVKLLVRGLTGRQRAKLLQNAVSTKGDVDLERIYPELVIYSVYDPDTGEQVFKLADRDALADKSGAALERITQVAMRLSGLTPEAVKEAKNA